jgi:hypothetical protein
MMLSILGQDAHHTTSWETTASLEEKHPDLDEDQIATILKVNNASSANELLEMKAGYITTYASIFNMFGQSSLDVLVADPEFRANDIVTTSKCDKIFTF